MLNRLLELARIRKDRSAEEAYLSKLADVRSALESIRATDRVEFIRFTLRQRHPYLLALLSACPPYMSDIYGDHIRALDWSDLNLAAEMLGLIAKAAESQGELHLKSVPDASGVVGAFIQQPFRDASATTLTASHGTRGTTAQVATRAAKEAADCRGFVAALPSAMKNPAGSYTKTHLRAAIEALDEQIAWLSSQ